MSDTAPRTDSLPGQMPRELRVEAIRTRLQSAFAPIVLEVFDDSHQHIGHAGARDGRGHYRVRVVSAAFAGLRPVARHQAIYAALEDMLQTDIHALAIQADTPPSE
jgi:BolA family transcriptional regulator, general stress-responsive regulator